MQLGLSKRSESNLIWLEVKHYCIWRPLKQRVEGCDTVMANNPATGQKVTKYGFIYDAIAGRAVKLEKYDTGDKYSKRYFGFKLHLLNGPQTFVLDMPYSSLVLRRFLMIAPNVDWNLPFSISAFKGKKKEGVPIEPTGIWFQQPEGTVKPYFTRENPNGMPQGVQDPDTLEWDFKAQHRWLVERLKTKTMPEIEAAAARVAPPIEQETGEEFEPPEHGDEGPLPDGIDIDDCPF